ncbi:hypothetical protein [Umezawaea beigongshangensis]|nr:hypothetical protein [Umezawaea beigongshangensis]
MKIKRLEVRPEWKVPVRVALAGAVASRRRGEHHERDVILRR